MSKRKHPTGGGIVVSMVVVVVVVVVAAVVIECSGAEVEKPQKQSYIVYTRLLLCALFIALNRKHSSLAPENFPEFNETFQTQVG
jgi:hypothetical protein